MSKIIKNPKQFVPLPLPDVEIFLCGRGVVAMASPKARCAVVEAVGTMFSRQSSHSTSAQSTILLFLARSESRWLVREMMLLPSEEV